MTTRRIGVLLAMVVGLAACGSNAVPNSVMSPLPGFKPSLPHPSPSSFSTPVPDPRPSPTRSLPPTTVPSASPAHSSAATTSRPVTSPAPPVTSSPGLRVGAAAVSYPTVGGVLLYGGNDINPSAKTDTWSWNGRAWARLATAGPVCPYGPGLGVDPTNGAALLLTGGPTQHEGSTVPAYASQTWRWNGRAWTQLHPAHALINGTIQSTVTDAEHHRLLAYVSTTVGDISTDTGDNATYTASSQMWSWNGQDWSRLYAHASGSGGRPDPLYAVNGPGGTILGVGQGTYRWTGSGWHDLHGTGSPSSVTSATYDPTRRRVVVVGASQQSPPDTGVNDDATFTFDGTAWTRGALPAPLRSRRGPVATWDGTDHGVLFGYGQVGTGNVISTPRGYTDSWLLDATGWRQVTR